MTIVGPALVGTSYFYPARLQFKGSSSASKTCVRVHLSHKINQHRRPVDRLGDRGNVARAKMMFGESCWRAQGVRADVAWRGSSDLVDISETAATALFARGNCLDFDSESKRR